ncbi:MAG: class I SAM-dependent methyltransferase [Rhodospirillaceae bacterium]
MKRLLRHACGWLALAAACAHAQQALDVPFVGTPPAVMDAMLALAKVGKDDFVIDLGCGDGRLVIAAAKRFGARGYGVDLDGTLVGEAQREAERQGVKNLTEFEVRNLYVTDISRATVLTLYLFPRVNLDLRPRLFRELKPGTRIVSHEFDFGDWQADAQTVVDVPDKPYGPPRSAVYLWIVPADASGRWVWHAAAPATGTYEVTLEQTFQKVKPAAGQGAHRIESLRLEGDRLTFVLHAGGQRQEYKGRVNGDVISGTVSTGDATASWTATRVARGTMNIEAARTAPPSYAKESR